MKVVIVFEFAGITDSNSPEADTIMEELGADTEGWRLDTGATAVYIEESFDSEQGAGNEDGKHEPHATFDEQHGGSDDPWDEAMGGYED